MIVYTVRSLQLKLISELFPQLLLLFFPLLVRC